MADHLAPDCIVRLERAAKNRFEEAKWLQANGKRLAAIYLFGFSVEMHLAAAYFRSAGFAPQAAIDRDTRRRRTTQARALLDPTGQPLMSSDPHPIVGWARLLEWQRIRFQPDRKQVQCLREAIHRAELLYKHWRPELRYKVTNVAPAQIDEVHRAALWFVENYQRL